MKPMRPRKINPLEIEVSTSISQRMMDSLKAVCEWQGLTASTYVRQALVHRMMAEGAYDRPVITKPPVDGSAV